MSEQIAEKSRTEYSAKNMSVAVTARIVAILTGFVTRVVFTHTLSQEYVGINGLFTDIISVLSLSELGIGTAITFALYKPIADKDREKQKSLMKMYRNFYYAIAGIVLVIGLCLIPFLRFLIKDHEQIDHLILIYLMYLVSSVLSYLMIYKKTLIDAHQMSYIGVLYHTIFLVLQYGLQIVILLYTKNFILYLLLINLTTIVYNIVISIKAEKMFPYLKDRDVKPLDKTEKKSIFDNIKAMMMHKIGNVLINNTDNMILSALVGTVSVGCYSNYYLIIMSVRQVLDQIFQAITASVGNLGVRESRERVSKIFDASFFMGQWIYGTAAIAMYEALDIFIGKSFGDNYIFPKTVTLVLCINFFINGMRQAVLVFRDSMGLFWYDRYKAIPEAIINLVVSIILGYYFGTIGIFLGTLISMVLTSVWVEPFVLYKYRLKKSSVIYFVKYGMYTAVTFAIWYGQHRLFERLLPDYSWRACVLRAVFSVLITTAVYLLIYHRMREFKLLMDKGMRLIRKKLKSGRASSASGVSDKDRLSDTELLLISYLRQSLTGEEEQISADEEELKGVYKLAAAHGVTGLLYESPFLQAAPEDIKKRINADVRRTILQNYRILFADKYVIGRLKKNNINAVILKGPATGSLYKVPEMRKTGDVDVLLINEADEKKAKEVMQSCGYRESGVQHANHHTVYDSGEGFEIELHTDFVEPFDNERINRLMADTRKSAGENIINETVMGVSLPILKDGYHAYGLILHMLQHFLRAGFGIRLICDWVVFWNRDIEEEEKKKYLDLVTGSGIKGFSDLITAVCCEYLGLKEEFVEFMDVNVGVDIEKFMIELFEAGEFGKTEAARMVALRGDSPAEYIREFHHQMHLNYPKAGRMFIFWPVLWVITLCRFLKNNRTVRGVSTGEIMKNASKRGALIKKTGLFDKKNN